MDGGGGGRAKSNDSRKVQKRKGDRRKRNKMVAHICEVLPKGRAEGRGEGGGGCVKPPSLRGDKLLTPCNRFKRLVSVIIFVGQMLPIFLY
jgi:hypothetical protein